jgi:hypothetical protein
VLGNAAGWRSAVSTVDKIGSLILRLRERAQNFFCAGAKPALKALLVLGIVLICVQPLVVYLEKFLEDDCDDQAVHFYAAMRSGATAEARAAFNNGIRPFVAANEKTSNWMRTEFRLRAWWVYPLANVVIRFFNKPGRSWLDSVRFGLLTVTAVGLAVILVIGAMSPFGLFETAFVLNLLAFRWIALAPLHGEVPGQYFPFVTYVPRGLAAALVIAVIVALAARRTLLFVILAILPILWHVVLGAIEIPILLLGAFLSWCAWRSNMLGPVLLVSLLTVAASGGLNVALVAAPFAGFFYFYCIKGSSDFSVDPYDRAFLLTLLSLLSARCVSLLGSRPSLISYVDHLTSIPYGYELAERLSGVEYSLFVLLAYVSARLLVRYLGRGSEDTQRVHVGMSAVLIALSMAHLNYYVHVVRAKTSFFTDRCVMAQIIQLPERMADLSLEDEPSLFLSFGRYIERLSK